MTTTHDVQSAPHSRACSREKRSVSRPTTRGKETLYLAQVETKGRREEADDTASHASFEDDDFAPRREKLDLDEIKRELYQRECRRLKVTPIGNVVRFPTKTQLNLQHYSIGPNGAKALAVPLMLDSTLTRLDLEGNGIGPAGLSALVETLSDNCCLTHLNLANNHLGSRGAKLAARLLLKNNFLSHINLSGNGFRDVDSPALGFIIRECRQLRDLNLSDNELGEQAGSDLGDAIAYNDTLESLNISWNHIRRLSAAKLFQGLKENVGLKRLDLSFNGCGSEGVAAAGQALAVNPTLRHLDLSRNRIVDGDMQFAKQLTHNEALVTLTIKDNLLTDAGALALITAVAAADGCPLEAVDIGGTSVNSQFLEVVKSLQQQRSFTVTHGPVIVVKQPEQEQGPGEDGSEPGEDGSEPEERTEDGSEPGEGTEEVEESQNKDSEDNLQQIRSPLDNKEATYVVD